MSELLEYPSEMVFDHDRGPGYFIAFEGLDSVGKETQVDQLALRLQVQAGIKPVKLSYPRYNSPMGGIIKKVLQGKYGASGPFTRSMLYSLDRALSMQDLGSLEKKFVISNRYTGSNLLFQGALIRDRRARAKFYEYITDLEWDKIGIPMPNQTILLDMSPTTSMKLLEARGNLDENEANLDLQTRAHTISHEIAEREGWDVIKCDPGGGILPAWKVSDLIWDLIPNQYKEAGLYE